MSRKEKPSYYLAKTIAGAKQEKGIREIDLLMRLDVSVSQYDKLKAIFLQHPNLSYDRKDKVWRWQD